MKLKDLRAKRVEPVKLVTRVPAPALEALQTGEPMSRPSVSVREPSARELLAETLQSQLEKILPEKTAKSAARKVTGYGYPMGLIDITPAGIPLWAYEGGQSLAKAAEAAGEGEYGTAAFEGTLGALGLAPAAKPIAAAGKAAGKQAAAQYDALLAQKEAIRTAPGSLYKVDIPDEAVSRMLDWDKPLSEQAHLLKRTGPHGENYTLADELTRLGLEKDITGAELLKQGYGMDRNPESTAAYLQKWGIPGIKYLDEGSRGAGEGTRNFVLFDESLPRILEVNEKPTGALPWRKGEWEGRPQYPQAEALETARKNAVTMLGLPEENTAMDRARAMGADFPAVHFSRHGVDVNELDSGKFAVAPFDAIGTHVGVPEAALDRFRNTVATTDRIAGSSYPLLIRRGKEFLNEGKPWDEDALNLKLRQIGGHNWSDMHGGKQTYQQMNKDLREKLFSEFGSIPYVNDVEAKGQISHIVPPQNIRSRFAAFDPARMNENDLLGYAQPSILPYTAGAGALGGLGLAAMNDKQPPKKKGTKNGK